MSKTRTHAEVVETYAKQSARLISPCSVQSSQMTWNSSAATSGTCAASIIS